MFTYKKVGTKYICFGPGMKRIPGNHKTPRQAMATLREAKEAYMLVHTPSLVTMAQSIDQQEGPSEARTEESTVLSIDDTGDIPEPSRIEAMAQQTVPNEPTPQEETHMAKKPTSTTNTTESVTTKGIVPYNQSIIKGAPTKEAKEVRAVNKLKPGYINATTKAPKGPKAKSSDPKPKGGKK